MKLKDITGRLNLDIKAGQNALEADVTGGYVGDLLSDVLANAKKGNVWITLHTHLNIIAVASSKEISGIIIVNGRVPEQETLKKAEDEGIPILVTKMSAYNVVCRLHELGVN
ncbi:MAG: DRTGG domain-containing protein [Bacteroidetes bacterium]|jgi:DNA-binding LacI/PurR family transcriptional regulator|nr:DRTGG domain-containing protein [Bacteroidota bacterium]